MWHLIISGGHINWCSHVDVYHVHMTCNTCVEYLDNWNNHFHRVQISMLSCDNLYD